MGKLEGKVALITGASKGIGEGIAKVYARQGANLILCARSDSTQEFCNQLEKQYGIKSIFVKTDVTKMDDCKNAVNKGIETFGKIDILVSNAGVCRLKNFLDTDENDYNFHLDVNVKGAWNICRAILPSMVENKNGKIVIMSSVTGYMVADEGEVGYATSKAALIGLTKSLAREFAKDGINVNVVCPLAWTAQLEQFEKVYPEAFKANVKTPPMGHFGNNELEIGRVCVQLANPDFKYMTGETLTLEGGLGLRP